MFAALNTGTGEIVAYGLATLLLGARCKKRKREKYGVKRWWWGLFGTVSSNCAFLQVTPQPAAVTRCRSLLATTCCNYHFPSPFLLHSPNSEFGPFPFHIWDTVFCIHALHIAPQGKRWYCPDGTARERLSTQNQTVPRQNSAGQRGGLRHRGRLLLLSVGIPWWERTMCCLRNRG